MREDEAPALALDNILPDSRAREKRGVISVRGTSYVPIFCANCGKPGGGVSEEHCT